MTRFSKAPRFRAKRKQDIEGRWHNSGGEADWYSRLILRQRAGEIRDLECEPAWRVDLGDGTTRIVKADAQFFDVKLGRVRVVDFKGGEGETAVSKLKREMVRAQHGVVIELEGPYLKEKARRARKAKAAKGWAKFLNEQGACR